MQQVCHIETDLNDFSKICIFNKRKVFLPEIEWSNIHKYKDNNAGQIISRIFECEIVFLDLLVFLVLQRQCPFDVPKCNPMLKIRSVQEGFSLNMAVILKMLNKVCHEWLNYPLEY